MSAQEIGIIILILVFVLMFLKMHIGVAMGLAGFIGLTLIDGFGPAISTVGISAFTSAHSYNMLLIPLFLLMGELAFVSGLSKEAFFAAHKLIGHLPGGLAMATIGGCAGFAAVCGSSVATAMTMSAVALKEMRQRGYAPELSMGAIAAGGTLGILIPPSGCFVVYGIITEQSIGKLFISGILPGILLSVLFIIAIYIVASRNPASYPPGPVASWRERFVAIGKAWAVLVLFLIVIGGIYLGICTATEAASIGVFAAFLIAIGKRQLSKKNTASALLSTIITTGMIFWIIIGAQIFGVFFAVTQMPVMLVNFITSLSVTPLVVMIGIIVLFAILGCVMDSWAVMLLLVPILVPTIEAMKYDLIWFGVIMVIMVEMGLITPPVGINVFVLHGANPDVPLYTVFRGIWPFTIAMVVCIALLIAFPQIALFLPSMGG